METLFTKFEERYLTKNLKDCNNQFIRDGIINPVFYAAQSTKVLFIAKEHNYRSQHDYKNNHADYREWASKVVYLRFAHRLSEWAHGILNNFQADVDQLTYDQKHTALKSMAFINVKKVSGGATSDADLIGEYIVESRDLLHQQIGMIKPDLIVCCFRYDGYVTQLFDIPLEKPVSNAYSVGRWEGIGIINFWHPSARKRKTLLYAQLKEAVEQIRNLADNIE
ncbi:hypothetical protein [Larkinella knui]|nr:hypothetical protein [Larkinella knui]